jgi:hypothetical protein
MMMMTTYSVWLKMNQCLLPPQYQSSTTTFDCCTAVTMTIQWQFDCCMKRYQNDNNVIVQPWYEVRGLVLSKWRWWYDDDVIVALHIIAMMMTMWLLYCSNDVDTATIWLLHDNDNDYDVIVASANQQQQWRQWYILRRFGVEPRNDARPAFAS